jgi:hypothetical protein
MSDPERILSPQEMLDRLNYIVIHGQPSPILRSLTSVALRHNGNLSLVKAAKQMDIDPQYLHNILGGYKVGEKGMMRINTACQIATNRSDA